MAAFLFGVEMPDPKKYDSEDDWMAACVPRMTEEGREQEQAVAACSNMWRKKETDMKEGLWQAVKSIFHRNQEPEEVLTNPFMVWKEGDTYRWLAVYSNKFRDDDNPPEILADAAHRDFVEAVDKGEWPMPELWLWHVKGTRSGAADYVAYDDSGFAIASGTMDNAEVASRLAERDDLYTSHGMPMAEIRRDEADPTIITRYRTKEISPLPRWAAANKHGTGFSILLNKEAEMAIPDKKRPFLTEVMGEKAVEDLEHQLEGKAKELEAEGIEFKEAQVDEPETVKEEVVEAAPVEEVPQYVTHDELTEVFSGHIKPLVDAVAGLLAQVESLGKELKEQAEVVKGLQASDEEKIEKTMAQTPAASLFGRIGSVIGADETLVDGRSGLARSKPKEAVSEADGPTLVPWLNQLMAQQRGG